MLGDQAEIEFHYVTDAADAIATAHLLQPTVILQDLTMPSADGFALIREYREDAALRHVPVIVLSAKEEPKLKTHNFSVGANDYVVKLPDPLELLARIRYHSADYISRLQRDEAFQSLRASQKNLAEACPDRTENDRQPAGARRRGYNVDRGRLHGALADQLARRPDRPRRQGALRGQDGRTQPGGIRPRLSEGRS
ncbi:MAG: diguanylate cyclase response regulator [Massilia sp.]|nr:diguanylate cyclase response regulator [Massilia sp.]